MSKLLSNYVEGRWLEGTGQPETLRNPATEEVLGRCNADGVDRAAALDYARRVGGPALRALTFEGRAARIKALGALLHEHREELLGLAIRNGGNTRSDAKFDIDGASGTLMYYASLGSRVLGARRILEDGDWEQLGRGARYFGHHIHTSREGVAVLVNAFNFPAWGFAEKAAPALLAGMPVLLKPAASTALVASRVVQLAVQAEILPLGALSLLCGEPGDLVEHLQSQDVLAFTGSSATAARIRLNERVVESGARINVEADSLNAAVLGDDVDPDSDLFGIFLDDVFRDMTQKAGQKCTALRRVLVPEGLVEPVVEALRERLDALVIGNPELGDVRMGPVTSEAQLHHVFAGVARLQADAECLWGADQGPAEWIGVPPGKGYFVRPRLFRTTDPGPDHALHQGEVFGPVSTVVEYDGTPESACAIVRRGGGGLVTSLYTEDREVARSLVTELAPHHGRVYLAHAKTASESMGPGAVLPQLIHGGPGRAGAGEELGGIRGVTHYMQRTAIQGPRPLLSKLLGIPDE